MVTARKTADKRLKDLRLAMHRIQRGRAHTGATKVSVLAVATEAGVRRFSDLQPLPNVRH